MSMVRAVTTKLEERATMVRFAGESVLSWAEVMAGLVNDAGLREALTEAILGAPFAAVYWEARPVAVEDRDLPFECVVLDSPGLARVRADGGPFAQQLAGRHAPEVVTFANLSGDAELVVPAAGEDAEGYPHLAAFLRRAPAGQMHALWSSVGQAAARWLAMRGSRVWVSTAGDGVSWLHVRLDSRPKYIKWAAYRSVR